MEGVSRYGIGGTGKSLFLQVLGDGEGVLVCWSVVLRTGGCGVTSLLQLALMGLEWPNGCAAYEGGPCI